MNEQERQAFLAGPHIGVLSVANTDGRPPHSIPLWYAYEPGGDLTFFTGTQERKARKTALIRRAGAITLTVQREEFPYKYVTVEGTVVGIDGSPTTEAMLAIIRRYLPEEGARGFVASELLFTVRPDRWLAFDFGEGAA